MHCVKTIDKNLYWVGASDRRLALFENRFPLPRGMAYNSYLITDKKTVLLDCVDSAVGGRFFENVSYALGGRPLDYIVINHMEPDHIATMKDTAERYPQAVLVGSDKTRQLIDQFFDLDISDRFLTVKDGDTLDTGDSKLSFFTAPMVHWPEVTVAYDHSRKTLFSADAFGAFGALDGNIFADEIDFECRILPEARRYYANIVGKYGAQVQALIKKTKPLDIGAICPLHGPVWRKDLNKIIDKYLLWSGYQPEDKAVMIAVGSVYGNTQNAADILAAKLADRGIRDICVYDVASTHPSVLVSEAFRCSHLVFASCTYNAGLFPEMEQLLRELKTHNVQNRTAAVIENGSWAPAAGKLIREALEDMKNINVVGNAVTIKSSVKEAQAEGLEELAQSLAQSVLS